MSFSCSSSGRFKPFEQMLIEYEFLTRKLGIGLSRPVSEQNPEELLIVFRLDDFSDFSFKDKLGKTLRTPQRVGAVFKDDKSSTRSSIFHFLLNQG